MEAVLFFQDGFLFHLNIIVIELIFLTIKSQSRNTIGEFMFLRQGFYLR